MKTKSPKVSTVTHNIGDITTESLVKLLTEKIIVLEDQVATLKAENETLPNHLNMCLNYAEHEKEREDRITEIKSLKNENRELRDRIDKAVGILALPSPGSEIKIKDRLISVCGQGLIKQRHSVSVRPATLE